MAVVERTSNMGYVRKIGCLNLAKRGAYLLSENLVCLKNFEWMEGMALAAKGPRFLNCACRFVIRSGYSQLILLFVFVRVRQI